MPDRKEIIRQVEEKMAFGDSNNWTFTKKVEPMVTDRKDKEPIDLNKVKEMMGVTASVNTSHFVDFQWIDAEKELPEDESDVLVCFYDDPGTYPSFYDEGVFYDESGDQVDNQVAYWGYFPQVPPAVWELPHYKQATKTPDSPLNTQQGGTHYKDFPIQPVEYIHKNGIGYMEGNVIKYVSRHKSKNGKEDLLKAIHYLEMLIELEYGQE
jgi:hypothetical protein